MSAFLCTVKHTTVLAAYWARVCMPHNKTIREFAVALRRANNSALKARYGDKPVRFPKDLPSINQVFSAADIAALAACFRYQCSEGDDKTMERNTRLIRLIEMEALRQSGGKTTEHLWAI